MPALFVPTLLVRFITRSIVVTLATRVFLSRIMSTFIPCAGMWNEML